MTDLEHQTINELQILVAEGRRHMLTGQTMMLRGTEELLRRAVNSSGRETDRTRVDIDIENAPDPRLIDWRTVRYSEKLSDGKRRWVGVADIEEFFGCTRDPAIKLAIDAGVATQRGGKNGQWFFDRARLMDLGLAKKL